MWRPVQSAARYCSPKVLEFIEHDKLWCNPDQIDRDVQDGQLHKTMMMMYVCMLLPQAEGQGAGWPPVRRPLGPVWQPGEREKGAPSIGSSRAGDHELTWLGRDSTSFADVGEDAEAGGVQLHRRRRQLQGGSGPSDRSARHRTIKCRVPKMSTWWDHLNIILPHVCAIQVCIYVDGGSYDDPKIDWLEADPFKWSVIIDLV